MSHVDVDAFARIFRLPPAMRSYAGLVASEEEMALAVMLAEQPMTAEQIARARGMALQETEAFLERAFRREIVNRRIADGVTLYVPSTFYARMDVLAMFENELWRSVPAEARRALQDWQLQEYINTWSAHIAQIQQDPDVYTGIKNRDILLLDEALELVEVATDHVITRCDCRSIIMVDDDPIREVCVRLNNGARLTAERGQGRRVSKEEMKALVVDTDRSGLVHAGLRDWRGHEAELWGFCNCNAAYCYPIRAGIRLGMSQGYPRAHYVARRDESRCVQCGQCVGRCQFGACYHAGEALVFDPQHCWGCGLCANTCPEGAIQMEALQPAGGDR